MSRITTDQIAELLAQDKDGRVTREMLFRFLKNLDNGQTFDHELDYTRGPGLISRLVEQGGSWGCCNSNINDDNHPVKGEGVVKVRFRLVPGEELKRNDGWVYRTDVEAVFRDRGMRFPNAAEALLVPAKDKQIGRGKNPLVAFISGSSDAFIVDGHSRERYLLRHVAHVHWDPGCVFLGVCE